MYVIKIQTSIITMYGPFIINIYWISVYEWSLFLYKAVSFGKLDNGSTNLSRIQNMPYSKATQMQQYFLQVFIYICMNIFLKMDTDIHTGIINFEKPVAQ